MLLLVKYLLQYLLPFNFRKVLFLKERERERKEKREEERRGGDKNEEWKKEREGRKGGRFKSAR